MDDTVHYTVMIPLVMNINEFDINLTIRNIF